MPTNFKVISDFISSTKCLLYVIDASWDVSRLCHLTKETDLPFMALNAYIQQDLVSVSDGVRWRYTAQAVPVI